MMEKLKINAAILVEGKYDAAKLAGLVDTLILTTDGFSIYHDREKQLLLREIARARGLIILTDSDAAGFKIRTFVTNLVGREYVYEAFVPARPGKEKRKALPGKEGLLGVEGMQDEWILRALENALPPPKAKAGAGDHEPQGAEREITYADLYSWGLSGGQGSAEFRRSFLKSIAIPPRISKKSLLEVLNSLYTPAELEQKISAYQKDL